MRIVPECLLPLRGDTEKIDILIWALVVALACCLYAPELDIQSSETTTEKFCQEKKL
jgi:hypothetical protein